MEEGWKQGVTLCTPDSIPNASSIKPRCSERTAYRQEERTICQEQGGHEEGEIKPSTTKEELLKKSRASN